MDDEGGHRPSFFFFLFGSILLTLCLFGCANGRRTVTLAFLGDINLGRGVNPSANSFEPLAADMEAADLAMANLESPLSSQFPNPTTVNNPAMGYNLCAPAERASLLSEWGFDLVSIANNHSSDCGQEGTPDTISALEGAGIEPIRDNEAAIYRKVNGISLAFLALDDITAPVNMEAATEAIRSAHESGNVVIVSIHWGTEYQEGASARQKSLARQFAQAGAAVVWGHHPHVLQPVEWIQGDRWKTLVLYSLGNALFDQPGLADTRESAMALVQVNPQGAQSVHAVPFIIDIIHSRLVEPDINTAGKILERLKIE